MSNSYREIRVAVITPYCGESYELIEQCNQSVTSQTYPCTHVLIADGNPLDQIINLSAQHIILPMRHSDIGSTPRLIGAYHAIGLGYDAIAFLDADNWMASTHIEILINAHHETGAAFLSSGRWLCHLDGSPMVICPFTDPNKFVDTNCMLFMRQAFPLLHHWVLMPAYGHLIGDRIMLHHIRKSGVPRRHINVPSIFYRCNKAGIYRHLRLDIPSGVADKPDYESSFRRWIADGNDPL
jgi:hypothetical protein